MTTPTHYPTDALGEHLRFYIAGPMHGYPEFNFPMFDRARDFLRARGHIAISPADHDRQVDPAIELKPGFRGGRREDLPDFDYHAAMQWDLATVARDVDAILLLPGWEHSNGAGHERYVAEACGHRIFYFDGLTAMYEERPTRIIGLAGYAQSGKDTTGKILVEEHGFERLAFADALRDILYALNPVVHGDDHIIPSVWDVQGCVDAKGWEWAKAHTTARVLLQRLGTEAGRNVLGENVWVDACMRKVKPGGSYVITDVRFPNEVDAVRKRGGELWRIIRPGGRPANDHVSETAIADVREDITIYNEADVDALARTIRRFI